MALKISRKLKKALQISLITFVDGEKPDSKQYFNEAVQVASFLHSEDEMCVALLHGVYAYTKLSRSDLANSGYSKEVLEAVSALTTKEANFTEKDQLAVLASPLAMKVFLSFCRVRGNNVVIDPKFIQQVKDKLATIEPFSLRTNSEAEIVRKELLIFINRG